LFHFKEALRVEPHHPEVQYMVRMLTGPHQAATPPETYLRLLFEGYADHYETHLAQLEDRTPEVLFNLVDEILNGRQLELMLDMGCGTGRCGVYFRPLVTRIVGVDLSAAMLQGAAEKKIYDALHEAEMIAYLTQHEERYDLILAGDVLVYQGALERLFYLLASRLKPKGLFAFSVEVSDDADYIMQPSGRFAHHPRYITTCAQALRSQRLRTGGREVSLYVMTL
jgi:predicted TPR repeat methyltransferase